MAQLHQCGKQTAQQLAQQHRCSRKTILCHLKKYTGKAQYAAPTKANIIMDTTYFGKSWGIMVLYDSIRKQALFAGEVKYEPTHCMLPHWPKYSQFK